MWRLYEEQLAARPLATKAVVMALGLATGDVLAKLAAGTALTTAAALHRMASMFVFGLLFQGPALHFLYRALDRAVMPRAPKTARAVLAKTVIDQVGFAPFATAAFLAAMELLAGGGIGAAAAAVRARVWPTLLASYMLWPAALLVNYSLVPPRHRVLYVNAVTVLWSAILSTITA